MATIPVEDRVEITELTHRYSLYCDTGQVAKLVALFTEDAIMDETGIGLPRAEGRDNLVSYFEEGPKTVSAMVHYVSNHIIEEFSGDAAKGLCFVLCEARLTDGAKVRIFGYYDDVYAKVDGAWRFRSRYVKPLMPPELGTYLDKTAA